MKALLIIIFAYTSEGGLHTVTLEYQDMERCRQVASEINKNGAFTQGRQWGDSRIRVETICVPAK